MLQERMWKRKLQEKMLEKIRDGVLEKVCGEENKTKRKKKKSLE